MSIDTSGIVSCENTRRYKVIVKRIKKQICNKSGYTTPTALAFMFLILALAGSVLLVASYRFQNAHIRKAENQLYLHARSLVEQHTEGVLAGELNETLARAIDTASFAEPELVNYAKSYEFEFTLGDNGGEPRLIESPFTAEKIDFRMIVTYEPQGAGIRRPAATTDYIKIGDRMTVEYRIRSRDMEYRIVAEFYCSRNSNVSSTGVPIASPQAYVNMEWTLNQYTGNFHNLRGTL